MPAGQMRGDKNMKNNLIDLAKQLRKNQTEHEAKLWSRLRDRRFVGFKFIRQYPIGNYIVDFCCRQKKLIIELDGCHHNEEKNIEYDIKRDKYLKLKGYKVLRIPNIELRKTLMGLRMTFTMN